MLLFGVLICITKSNISKMSHEDGNPSQKGGEVCWLVCLFVLRFYGPVNPMGSCRERSVT